MQFDKKKPKATVQKTVQKKRAPNRTGQKSDKYRAKMIKAIEQRLVDKPSGAELKRYAKGGSNTTVKEVLEHCQKRGLVVKNGQWRFVEKKKTV